MICVLILLFLYLFSLMGRRNHPLMEELKKWDYAHRGLHDDTLPENSLGAFRAAVEHSYGAELDIHLLKDGSLAVLHDSDLLRMTGMEGMIENLTANDLPNYHLSGTEYTIPLFRDVLEVFNGKTPLIVELKAVGNNYAALCEAACKMLDTYDGLFCLESFDPRCIRWLKQNRPELVRGQLSENYLKRTKVYSVWMRFAFGALMTNFLTRPDFIAYRFEDRKNLSVFLCEKLWGITQVSWTIQNLDDFKQATKENRIPIFENFKP